MKNHNHLCVGDWAVDVSQAGNTVEIVVHSHRPGKWFTIVIGADGVLLKGDLPPMGAVQLSDFRDLLSHASESLSTIQRGHHARA